MNQFYIETLEFAGFGPALKAMRLPMKSEDKSDSEIWSPLSTIEHYENGYSKIYYSNEVHTGPIDMKLIQKLIRSGDEHAKILRGIMVWFEINAPRYFHVELDTYRIGAERLSSESTMHVECKNFSGEELQKAKGEIKESHMQKRIWMKSYQTLRRMYFQRRNHRLPEWQIFCDWIEGLPFADKLITINPWYIDKIEELEQQLKFYEN